VKAATAVKRHIAGKLFKAPLNHDTKNRFSPTRHLRINAKAKTDPARYA
jgi:hypothetical protein